jgi:predicted CXXCH cytochrome family protein
MNMRSARINFIVIAMIVLPATALTAQEKNEKAENSGAQACTSCHEPGTSHKRNYDMWAASGHSKALSPIINNSQASPECYGCHSDEGFKARLLGKKVDVAQKESFNPVTCVTCHKPHDSKTPHHLVMDVEDLCTSCHQQRAVLQGKGAKGLDEMRSFHSAVDCFSCHMSEGNHLMKVIRPDDPNLSEKRLDTCTTCHKDNNRKARMEQIQQWQASYKEGMERLQADLSAITAALKEKPNLLDEKAKSKLKDVRFNLQILEKDGSRGTHNIDFATEIMSNAEKDLKPMKAGIKLK